MVLRAYPKGSRRDEVRDTLTSSSPAESAAVVFCGLGRRLRRPLSRWVVTAAVLVALTTGYFGAALAARLAWEAAPGFPPGTYQSVFPGTPGRATINFPGPFDGTDS